MIQRIQQVHELYCRLTGQRVSLRFDRERLWYELFQAGFNKADFQRHQFRTGGHSEIDRCHRLIPLVKFSGQGEISRSADELDQHAA